MEVAGLEVASDLAQVPEKGHHADRFRGQGLFAPRWTAANAAMVGVCGGDKTIHWNAGFVLSEAE
jgi:hypothetical protein